MKKRKPSRKIVKDKPKKKNYLPAIALGVLGSIIAGLILYLLLTEESRARGDKFVLRWPFTPAKITDAKLQEAVAKFPDTVRELRSVRGRIENEGYDLAPGLIDRALLQTLCRLVASEETDEAKLKNNCFKVGVLAGDPGAIAPATKQAWAKKIYQIEYDSSKGFTVDGIIDDREARALQELTLNNLRQNFTEKTKPTLLALDGDIRSTDPLVQDTLVQTLLPKTLKLNTAEEASDGNRGSKEKRELQAQAPWMNAIYNFQIKQKLPADKIAYGLVTGPDDPTYQKIEQALVTELKVPDPVMENARRQFARTKQGIDGAIRAIYNGLVNDKSLKTSLKNRYPDIFETKSSGVNELNVQLEEDIKEKFLQFLGVRSHSLDFDFLATIDEPLQLKEEKWTTAIYRYQKYQQNQKNADGTLFAGGNLSRSIIDTIGRQLRDELRFY